MVSSASSVGGMPSRSASVLASWRLHDHVGRHSTVSSIRWSLTRCKEFVGLSTIVYGRCSGFAPARCRNPSIPAAEWSIKVFPLIWTTSPASGSIASKVRSSPCASAPYVAMKVLRDPSLSTSRNPESLSSRSPPMCWMPFASNSSRITDDHSPVPTIPACLAGDPDRAAACNTRKLPPTDGVTESATANPPGCGSSPTPIMMSTHTWPSEITDAALCSGLRELRIS